MTGFNKTTDESKRRWDTNADFWDARMGDRSNFFHRSIVRPHTDTLLKPGAGEHILDIACGNGNYSEYLAEKGAQVTAFDFSEKLISHAKSRREHYPDRISFIACDATNETQLQSLMAYGPFDKAVANMALMDISDIKPLLKAIWYLLRPGGIFVFSIHHPCFLHPERVYRTTVVHEGEAIIGQPVKQYYYHRSLQDLFRLCFDSGFILDGFIEECDEEPEYPVICIIRIRKMSLISSVHA